MIRFLILYFFQVTWSLFLKCAIPPGGLTLALIIYFFVVLYLLMYYIFLRDFLAFVTRGKSFSQEISTRLLDEKQEIVLNFDNNGRKHNPYRNKYRKQYK